METIIMLTIILVIFILITARLTYVVYRQAIKLQNKDKKYNDKMDEVTKQYFQFDEDIEEANKEIETLKKQRYDLKQRLWYT
ncbi:MAG: hypothetical protein GY932_15285, partial [Arcobacter sp.]|nr:hypothetical protein [Arcobacter sp.]